MLIDLRRCIHSHPCSLACKAEYEVPLSCHCSCPGYETEMGTYPQAFYTDMDLDVVGAK